jgi:hypothetical protein
MVDRSAFDRVIQAGGYVSINTGNPVDANSILIPKTELNAGVINNIAAIIVHESLHLYFLHKRVGYAASVEERLCYLYELEFLKKIPNVEPWLIKNAERQIKIYANTKDFK